MSERAESSEADVNTGGGARPGAVPEQPGARGRVAGRPRGFARPGGSLHVPGLASRYGLLLAWAVEIVIFGLAEPGSFLTVSSFQQLASSQAHLVMLSLAVVPTLAVAEIDLSIASVMAMSATVFGQLNGVDHWNLWGALALTLAGCLLIGAVNGAITVYLRVRGIVVTLGMGTLALGVALEVSNNLTVGGISPGLQKAVSTRLLGISVAFYVALVVAVVLWYLLRHTPAGRSMLFIGFNREVSRLSGIPVSRLRLTGFVLSSGLAGVAGIVAIGVAGGADPTSFSPLLLPAFAATFLGTLIFTPGRVNPLGNVVALYFLATGIFGIELLGVGTWINDVFYGGALVVIIAMSGLSDILGLKYRKGARI